MRLNRGDARLALTLLVRFAAKTADFCGLWITEMSGEGGRWL